MNENKQKINFVAYVVPVRVAQLANIFNCSCRFEIFLVYILTIDCMHGHGAFKDSILRLLRECDLTLNKLFTTQYITMMNVATRLRQCHWVQ